MPKLVKLNHVSNICVVVYKMIIIYLQFIHNNMPFFNVHVLVNLT